MCKPSVEETKPTMEVPKGITTEKTQTSVKKQPDAAKRGPMPFVILALAIFYQSGALGVGCTIARNCIFPSVPPSFGAIHGNCSDEMLAKELTIVVSVKDACSQAPGFLKALENIVPPSVHLIYAYPNFKSCAQIDMSAQLKWWNKKTMLPLPLRSSPMQGWEDAVKYIKTPYSLLMHNDGYALDDFFACELVQALKAYKEKDPSYSVAAPMLYESKHDGSLAAHATQSNLRLVADRSKQGMTVRHDHSVGRALNRGHDYAEGPQMEFVEDHAFLIDTDKISTIVDPKASFTLEYLDMIMTIRANNWKVLFVPSARLEFRIAEFSWRDIPYFMYKRSEITAHGTRDYLMKKWEANFPNTGFWTFIKYTIVENHVYRDEMANMPWKDQAALAFGYMQMSGYNRYQINGKTEDFIDVLQRLDRGWKPSAPLMASRELVRKNVSETKPKYVQHLEDILPWESWVKGLMPGLEADMPLEYLPFGMAEVTVPDCGQMPAELEGICGIIVQHPDRCSCWIDLPTFKSDRLLIHFLNHAAGWVKIPSRATCYLEMMLDSTRNASLHVQPLRQFESSTFKLTTCDQGQTDCSAMFEFGKNSRLKQWQGRQQAPSQVAAVMSKL